MPRYSEEFKAKVVEKMMPPNARTVADVHRETGVSEPTLYAWRREFQNRGEPVPADPANPESWSGRDKLAVVIETAALNEQALSEYCRRKGLYPEQIERWKEAAMAGSADPQRLTRDERAAWQQEKKRTRDLERELRRKEKALAEAAALLVLKKKPRPSGGRRGRMSTPETRALALDLIDEAVDAGARAAPACAVLGLTPRTLRRWRALAGSDTGLLDGRTCTPRVPANRLTPQEQEAILAVCNEVEHRSLPPTQIVPRLADQGVYLASESSFYRVLRAHDQLHRRGRATAPRQIPKPEGVCATAPNTAWCWDITFLASSIRGQFYRLYLIEDLFSRKIIGWEVHAEQCAEHASRLIERACLAEGVHRPGLVLHSDNGSPMKGATMLSTLQRLGVVPSFSRPSVSDDNPYAESLFRTLKYTPAFPNQPFASLADARAWVARFVHWYNEEHRHSKIRFVTPGQRHRGEDIAILAHRHQVYQDAQQANPTRWSRHTRNWTPIDHVWLNPPKEHAQTQAPMAAQAA